MIHTRINLVDSKARIYVGAGNYRKVVGIRYLLSKNESCHLISPKLSLVKSLITLISIKSLIHYQVKCGTISLQCTKKFGKNWTHAKINWQYGEIEEIAFNDYFWQVGPTTSVPNIVQIDRLWSLSGGTEEVALKKNELENNHQEPNITST